MSGDRALRRLSAILAADIVGYSSLVEADEKSTLEAIRDIRTHVIDPSLAEHRGRIVKLIGDGILAEFGSVVDAVACAVALQQGIPARQTNTPPERRIVFRIGVNLGDVVVEGDDLMGDGVNVAARLEQLCDPGSILISGTAYDHLQGKLGLPIDFIGEQQVKNISRRVRAYRVRLDGKATRPRVSHRNLRRAFSVAAAALLILGASAAAWWWLGYNEKEPSESFVAVLPFDSHGGSEADERLAEGITEDIITDLSRFRGFGVIARNSTAAYKGKSIDVRQVAKDLGVRYVLEGSLQRQGEQVRIAAQLVDATTGANIWTDRYDRPAADLFAVQSEIADKVTNTLGSYRGQLEQAITAAAKRKPPANLGAYELYLLGIEAVYRGDEASLRQAVDLFKRALAADPNFARGYVGLSFAYSMLANISADPTDLRKQQMDSARRALELDPSDLNTHLAVGYANGFFGDPKIAEAEFEEALRLNPNSFDAISAYAGFAATFGKAKEGAEAAQHAMRLNPSYPTVDAHSFIYAFFMAGRPQDVLQAVTRLPEDEFFPGDYVYVADSLTELGRKDDAQAMVARGVARFPVQLSIEGLLNLLDWTPYERPKILEAMRRAGFPACTPEKDASGATVPPPRERLPECEKKITG